MSSRNFTRLVKERKRPSESYQVAYRRIHQEFLREGKHRPRNYEDLTILAEYAHDPQTTIRVDDRCKSPRDPTWILSWAEPQEHGHPRWVLVEGATGAKTVLERPHGDLPFIGWPWSEWFDGVVLVPAHSRRWTDLHEVECVAISSDGTMISVGENWINEWQTVREFAETYRVTEDDVRAWPTLAQDFVHRCTTQVRNLSAPEPEEASRAPLSIYPDDADDFFTRGRRMMIAYEVDPDLARQLYPELDL